MCSLALLVVAIDMDIDIFRGESFLSASFVIPNGRIRLIQLPLGVLVHFYYTIARNIFDVYLNLANI